ncbi:MAG: CBS domain-containing protein [Deltaproteobacteria bacterium]|nr:CBS domain-containing protein [Deltaproteobacteria bacterium]
MPENLGKPPAGLPPEIDLKDQDIYAAMKSIPGYLDITPGDFKEVYRLAYAHALERLSRAVAAREIMTREVVSVRPDTPLAAVAEAMGRRGISGVPVVDAGGKVLGVISEKDFLTHLGVAEPQNFLTLVASCLQSGGCVGLPLEKQQAGDIMTSPAVTVGPDTSVKDIAALFTAKGINRVPVTDAEGRLLGLVSRGDLVRAAMGGAAQ